MPSHVIKIDIDDYIDFDLIGIVSSDKDYKLVSRLNNALGVDLQRVDDSELVVGKNGKLLISTFKNDNENFEITVYKNKTEDFLSTNKPFLIPELKEYDYFLKFGGESDLVTKEEIIEGLKNINSVQLYREIDVENLGSKYNLIN